MANFLTDERGGRDVLRQGELRTKKMVNSEKGSRKKSNLLTLSS